MSRIIDGHTHIASTKYMPRSFLEGVVDNIMAESSLSPIALPRRKILDHMISFYQDHDGRAQLEEMDKANVESSIVLLPDFTYTLRDCELTIEEMFKQHAEIVAKANGRFIVLAGVDPRWGRDGFRLFADGIEKYDFAGLKLYTPCGYRADCEELKPFYEYCEEYCLPIVLHVGPTSPVLSFSSAHPMEIDDPARRYRNISFIMAHGGLNHQDDCIDMCRYRPNVFLDVSGCQAMAADPHSRHKFINLFRSRIPHKVIYGTDWPLNRRATANKILVDAICSSNVLDPPLNATESALVMSGNVARILQRSKARHARKGH